MKNQFTALIIAAAEGGFIARCPEVPEANGQGETVDEARQNLADAIEFVFEVRRDEALQGAPAGAVQEIVEVG